MGKNNKNKKSGNKSAAIASNPDALKVNITVLFHFFNTISLLRILGMKSI